jgi:hypothetical protein
MYLLSNYWIDCINNGEIKKNISQPHTPPRPVAGIALLLLSCTPATGSG